MHDFDRFERKLAAALRSDADMSLARFEPVTVASEALASAQRPSVRIRRRFTIVQMSTRWTIAAAAVIGVIVIGGLYYVNRPDQSAVGGPSPTPSADPSQPAVVGPSATSIATTPPAPGAWTATGSMTVGHESHTATLLPDGTVLVAGGNSAATDLYDPASRSWTATGTLIASRRQHTATLLTDGRVLVVGGDSDNNSVLSAELYDPATGTWTATGPMIEAHGRGHTATLLRDGSVLVAGGFQGGTKLASAEVYDPATDSWTATGDMTAGRTYHTATLLPDGTVLVAGSVSSDASAERYDPAPGTWSATGSMNHGRHDFTATLLPDGTVLAASYEGFNGSEVYDPSTGTWDETASMSSVRVGTYTATLLPDDTVLVVGGVPDLQKRTELYDPHARTWAAGPDTLEPRQYHTATLLPDGTVLVAGGRGGLASAEVYAPPAIASASLPALRLPSTHVSPAGEYGWEGAPGGSRAGMHRVTGDGSGAREATAMLFAVGAECLTPSEEQQLPVRVAGFDGVSVEPYEPAVGFNQVGDEITRAYALAVGDRTLCLYLTWHPTTTDDELDAAVKILDSLRAQPIGEDRIRIVFALDKGWDTG
jgi:hypothetical protein